MDLYWPQNRVYLFGRAVLQPETLEGHDMDIDAISHYSKAGSISNIVSDLRQYEAAGYFKLEVRLSKEYLKWERDQHVMASRVDISNYFSFNSLPSIADSSRRLVEAESVLPDDEITYLSLELKRETAERYFRFRIVGINKQMFQKELTEYLTKYQDGDLTTGGDSDPDSFAYQKNQLVGAVTKNYPRQELKPTIKRTDLWSLVPRHDTFWELIFTHHLITHEIEVLGMGYDDRFMQPVPGISTKHIGTIPFAKFKVTGEQMRVIVTPATLLSRPAPRPAVVQNTQHQVSITMPDTTVYATVSHGNKHLVKKLRVDNAPYNFMQYVLTHPDVIIPIATIQTEVEGCKSKQNLTELVRDCGFNKQLKGIFFPGTTAKQVRFKQQTSIDSSLLDLFS